MISFGSVTVRGDAPQQAMVEANVALGQSALRRVLKALAEPGIRLPDKNGIPLYRADPNEPGVLIRRLNGREERGRIADGEFKVSE